MTTAADKELIEGLTAPSVLALTIYGEARGERIEGKVGVANVIRNRVESRRFGGDDYKTVCLAPWQFSCWKREGGAANYETLLACARLVKAGREANLGPAMRECVWVANGIIGNCLQDNTRKATHYITRDLWESKPPKWAIGKTPCAVIDRHVYFNSID